MATDLKFSDASLTAAALDGSELIPCTQGGNSKVTTAGAIAGFGAPGAATDNALVRFDGTTGKTVQNGLVTEDDNGRLTSPTGANGGYAFGAGTCYLYEAAANQPALRRAGVDVLDVADLGGGVIRMRIATSGGILLSGSAGPNQQIGSNTERFTFGGGGGTDWYAEGSGGVSAWVAGVAGDFTGVSRGIRAYRSIEANAAGAGSPNLLAATESRRALTNEGATAENYHTLPTAAAGLEFMFVCQDTDGIRIVANAGDTIRIESGVSAVAGFIRSVVVGSVVTLLAINATEWFAVNKPAGTWTIDI